MRKIETELGVSVGTGFLVCDDGVEIRIPDHEAVTGHDFLETVSYADNLEYL